MSLTCTAYHCSAFFKARFLFIAVLLFSVNTHAQNLLANPGFEDINNCTEYHADCAIEAWFNIPAMPLLVKNYSAPRPVTGHNFLLVPVENFIEPVNKRAVVYTMLCCPLIENKKYKLFFYLNTSTRKFYHLDFYFTEKDPNKFGFNVLAITPSFTILEKDFVADYKDWKVVEYEFTANGNERYMVLGNFSAERMDYQQKDLMNKLGDVFYFIDDISLKPVSTVPLCAEYKNNIEKLYAQNYRHSDFIAIIKDTEAVIKRPIFVKDTLTIPAVFFETSSAVLKPSFNQKMDSITNSFSEKKITKIDIIGHTDNKGTPEKNMQLSLARATAIKNYFINKFPQYIENIFVSGKGQDQPIATNRSEQGRTKNRRVEIILTIIDQSN